MTLPDAIQAAFPALAALGAVVSLFVGMVAAIRWAKRASTKVAGLGGALMLMFTMGVVPPREQQTIEEAKESKDRKGAESGDPPSRGDRLPRCGLDEESRQ